MMKPDEIKKHLAMVNSNIDELADLKNSLLMVNLFYGIQDFFKINKVDSLFIFLSHQDGTRKISTHHEKSGHEVNLSLFQILEIGSGTMKNSEVINFNETVSIFSINFKNFNFNQSITLNQFLHNHCPSYCLKTYLNYYFNSILPEKLDANQVKI